MRASTAVAVWLVCSAFACDKAEKEDDDDNVAVAAVDTTADHSTNNQLREAWVAAAENDDAATVSGMYTDDAVFMSPDGKTYNGRAAIEAAMKESFPNESDLKVTESTYAQSGDVAYATGEFTETVTTPAKTQQKVSGKYLVVIRRQTDGSWKIARHIGVANAPTT